MVGEERPGRVGDLQQPGLGHLEDADLLGGPESVLGRPQETQRGVPLALEVEDGVDEVLEGLRAGDGAVLGHVADQDDRDPIALRELHEPQRRLRAPGRRCRPRLRGRPRSRSGPSRRRQAPAAPRGPSRRFARPRAPRGPGRPPRTRRRAGRAAPPEGGPGPAIPRLSRTGHRARRGSGRQRPGGGGWTCRSPARHRRGPASRARARRRAPGRAHRSRAGGAAGPSSAMAARPTGAAAPSAAARSPTRSERDGSRTTVSTRRVPAVAGAALPFPAKEGLPAGLADEAALGPRHR